MKKLLILFLAFALTACGAAAPAQPQQPAYATVLVTVIATQESVQQPPAPAPTQEPPTAAPTQEPPTAAPTQPAMPEATATQAGQAAVGFSFDSISRSGDKMYLRCAPSEITFNVSTTNQYVANVYFYYRMEDLASGIISQWFNAGTMNSDGNGNYSLVFSALQINPDVRYKQGWMDYQFVAVNEKDNRVGNSEKFVKLITWGLDCP